MKIPDYTLPSLKNVCPTVIKELRALSYAKMENAAKTFVTQSALRLKAGEWLNGVEPTEAFLAGKIGNFKILTEADVEELFTPYVEKHLLSAGSEVAIIGDIHGDLDGLISVLECLRKRGYLNNDYIIERQNFYMVFIGDYTNRSKYSVEVMLLLFLLCRKNVGSVFMLRGNHEYATSNKDLYEKYLAQGLDERETLLGELAQKLEVYYYPDFLYWYDYLPVGLFMGCSNEHNETNFVQFSHAGIELGFNPRSLLQHPTVRYQRITSLERYDALQKLLHNDKYKHLHARIKAVLDYLSHHERSETIAASYLQEEKVLLEHPHSPLFLRLGLQWNSFLPEDHDVGIAASLRQKNIHLGRDLTEYFFDQASSEQEKLISIIRGHQHFNDYDESIGLHSDMLDKIIANNGCLRQWDGLVYTLGDLGFKTGYRSFIIMTMAEKKQDWKIQHCFNKPGNDVFQEQTFGMF